VCNPGAAAEFDVAQWQRERHGSDCEKHQNPEDVTYASGAACV